MFFGNFFKKIQRERRAEICWNFAIVVMGTMGDIDLAVVAPGLSLPKKKE